MGTPKMVGLPPCGGSGLKCNACCDFLAVTSLPPCGGSGLKFIAGVVAVRVHQSPSMRREWIEIAETYNGDDYAGSLPPCGGSGLKYPHLHHNDRAYLVSLHAEGVD